MADLFVFALVASAVMTVAYAAWSVLQRGTTFSRFNRLSLLCIVAVSVIAGSVYVVGAWPRAASVLVGKLEIITASAPEAAHDIRRDAAYDLPWRGVAVALYTVGFVLTALWHMVNLGAVVRIIARSRRYRLRGVTLAVSPRAWPGPFSWGRWIVVPRTPEMSDRTVLHMVVCHELTHLRRFHWADLLLTAAVKSVMWFNPSAWLLAADLSDTHEYEADRAVTARYDASAYQMLLIKTTVGSRLQAMADSLNHSSLKKRITMMMRNPTKSRARWRALAIVPAVAVALTVVNVPAVAATLRSLGSTDRGEMQAPVTGGKVTQKTDAAQEQPVAGGETMPRYIGGDAKLIQDLCDIMQGVPEGTPEGRTLVKFTVSAEGNITDPEVVRTGGEELDRFVLENITRLGRFTPGTVDGKPVAVTYMLPVVYKFKAD